MLISSRPRSPPDPRSHQRPPNNAPTRPKSPSHPRCATGRTSPSPHFTDYERQHLAVRHRVIGIPVHLQRRCRGESGGHVDVVRSGSAASATTTASRPASLSASTSASESAPASAFRRWSGIYGDGDIEFIVDGSTFGHVLCLDATSRRHNDPRKWERERERTLLQRSANDDGGSVRRNTRRSEDTRYGRPAGCPPAAYIYESHRRAGLVVVGRGLWADEWQWLRRWVHVDGDWCLAACVPEGDGESGWGTGSLVRCVGGRGATKRAVEYCMNYSMQRNCNHGLFHSVSADDLLEILLCHKTKPLGESD